MKRLSLTIASCLFLTLPIMAKVVRNYESASDNVLTFKVDSIDYRNDLTRVYGKLIGRPHTSNRIDGVNMAGNNYSVDANDIDGVDFRRYFQWEDDGTIPIEHDYNTLPTVKDITKAETIKSPGPSDIFVPSRSLETTRNDGNDGLLGSFL